MEESHRDTPEEAFGQGSTKKRRGWEEDDVTKGEEKMAKMGLECTTCGRPYDYAFFPQRIVQLSQKVREYDHPDQPKEKTDAWTDEGVVYQWEVIYKLEEKLKAKKRELEVKELELETKTKAQDGSEGREEEEEIRSEDENLEK